MSSGFKDFRPRIPRKLTIEEPDMAGAGGDPTEPEAQPPADTARELNVFSIDKFADEKDFRPVPEVDVEIETEVVIPKDSSALVSVDSSSSETIKETGFSAAPKRIVSVVKDSGQPKVEESGTQTS